MLTFHLICILMQRWPGRLREDNVLRIIKIHIHISQIYSSISWEWSSVASSSYPNQTRIQFIRMQRWSVLSELILLEVWGQSFSFLSQILRLFCLSWPEIHNINLLFLHATETAECAWSHFTDNMIDKFIYPPKPAKKSRSISGAPLCTSPRFLHAHCFMRRVFAFCQLRWVFPLIRGWDVPLTPQRQIFCPFGK